MRTLKFLLQKEFRQIFRNTVILRMIIALPIVQLLIIPLAADFEIKNIHVAVVDHDRSTFSGQLAEKIVASGYFRLSSHGGSFEAAYQEFEQDKADIILEIPRGFEQGLVAGQGGALFLAVNAINGTKASVGSAYLSNIIGAFHADIRMRRGPSPSGAVTPEITVQERYWFNPQLNYPVFMVPGILVILVTMVGAYMCALNIVKEKEVGTIEQINVTPVRKHLFILGKLIPFWVIGMFVFTLALFGVARLVYHIVPAGSVLLLYGLLSVYLVAVLGIGLLISTYSATQQQAMSLAFFCMMIFILMGGLFTTIESMPPWAQWIAKANPVAYFIEAMRMIVMKGSGWADVKGHLLAMAVMAVLFNALAVWNYRKTA